MGIKSVLFLGAVLLFIFGMHYAVFKSAANFFHIVSLPAKTFLYTIMVLLTFSFITAFFLIHWRETGWTILFYKFAATWMGFLIHFLVAVAIAWLVIGLSAMTGSPVNRRIMAVLFLAAASGFSLYGIWNAFHPRIREITVAVRNLPQAWNNARVVQLSDMHLGNFHGMAFAERVIAKVNALEPDLILITGDLFDGMGGPYRSFIEPLNRLRARKGIFFVTGNHEHYIGIRRAQALLRQLRLRVLDNETVEIDGLRIVGVSYPGIGSLSEVAGVQNEKYPRKPMILMFHTPTDLRLKDGDHVDRHFSTYWMPDTSFELTRKLDPDLQLSGHTHQGQLFPFPLLTRRLYRGHDYGMIRVGGMMLYTTSGTGSWGPPMRSGTRSEVVLIRLKPA